MVWLYRSPILVRRRGYFTRSQMISTFLRCSQRGRGSVSTLRERFFYMFLKNNSDSELSKTLLFTIKCVFYYKLLIQHQLSTKNLSFCLPPSPRLACHQSFLILSISRHLYQYVKLSINFSYMTLYTYIEVFLHDFNWPPYDCTSHAWPFSTLTKKNLIGKTRKHTTVTCCILYY